tara:strand:+ start:99 stop:392 length:294 start_codon:yes stop_codon:yes gene_type:complete
MDNLTIEQIKKIVEKHNKNEEKQLEYREVYRKTDKGRKRHNINSRRTYYRQKLRALEGIEDLSERQKKYKIKWEQNLANLITPTLTPELVNLEHIYL